MALAKSGMTNAPVSPEISLWLALTRCIVGEVLANQRISAEEYLTLVDATGRALKAGKRGAIPPESAPICHVSTNVPANDVPRRDITCPCNIQDGNTLIMVCAIPATVIR